MSYEFVEPKFFVEYFHRVYNGRERHYNRLEFECKFCATTVADLLREKDFITNVIVHDNNGKVVY